MIRTLFCKKIFQKQNNRITKLFKLSVKHHVPVPRKLTLNKRPNNYVATLFIHLFFWCLLFIFVKHPKCQKRRMKETMFIHLYVVCRTYFLLENAAYFLIRFDFYLLNSLFLCIFVSHLAATYKTCFVMKFGQCKERI